MSERDSLRALPLTRPVLLFAAGLVFGPWAIVVFILFRTPPPPDPAWPARRVANGNGSTHGSTATKAAAPGGERSSFGPWGDLQLTRVQIEPPEDIIRLPSTGVSHWHFPGIDPAELEKLWTAAGLSAAHRATLALPAHREHTPAGIVVRPPLELLLSLTPEARRIIYTELAAFPQNALHADPFRFRADSVDEWFADSGLAPAVVERIRRLIYIRANSAAFSDLEAVLPLVPDEPGRIRLLKTLSRKTALIASLKLSPDSDTEGIAGYWGQGRRSKDLGVLLESLAQRPGGGTLDIVHLLPPFARLLLYTFPTPSEDPRAAARDCHWTSFNFYAAQADDRFTDIGHVKQVLDQEYYPVGGTPAFGDIILLVQGGTQGVHSCIHVADDIVFTKNGASASVPWTLARLETVVAFYSFSDPVEIRRYRRRER